MNTARPHLQLLPRCSILFGLLLVLAGAASALGPEPFAVKATVAGDLADARSATLVVSLEVPPPFHVNASRPTFDYLIPTSVTVEPVPGVSMGAPSFPEPKMLAVGGMEEPIAVYDGTVRIRVRLTRKPDATPGPRTVKGVLRYQSCDDNSCYPPVSVSWSTQVTVLAAEALLSMPETAAAPSPTTPSDSPQATAAGPLPDSPADALTASAASSAPGTAPSESSLPLLLLFAFLGGLLLNLMPCVLPVLSLKVLGLIQNAHESRGRSAALGLSYTAGVLVSFWALAGVVVAARAAGSAVGWGFQFQDPGFVAALSGVVTAFALSLFGAFELNLPGAAGSRMAAASAREGLPGAFLGGVFATLLATPCTAPFLGAAMGFAFTQPALTLVAFFTAAALGLALPYLALVLSPAARRFLPKPGAWMERLKQGFGFLMLATLLWLWFVLGQQSGPEAIVLVAGWNLLAAFAIWASFAAAGLEATTARRLVARLLLVVAVAAGWMLLVRPAIALRPQAALSAPATHTESSTVPSATWIPYDPALLEKLRAEGRTVLVDATADWCLTCKVNERTVLKTDRGMDLFRRHDVVLMIADWTVQDPVVTEFLSSFGRAGVPFYVVYKGSSPPVPLPEVLTPAILESAIKGEGA